MLLSRYLPRTEFSSYEDFMENYAVSVPDHFNFGFDIVDEWARIDPDKPALVWCDDRGEERTFTFGDIRGLSNRAARFFLSHGVGRGGRVMLILRRRWEYWVCAVALCKIGAVVIPATLQLTAKDIVYRCRAADVRMLVCVDDDFVIGQAEEALPSCPSVAGKAVVAGRRNGWLSFGDGIRDLPGDFARPPGTDAPANDDLMLMYFTSGTTGMPKMVTHNFTHPLGHIVTARYWQQVEDGRLHLSVSDSGWAKFGWGKIYGQWICGAVIFAYDMDRFVAGKLLAMIGKHRLTTFCAPPTMYRFMLQEDVASYDLSSLRHLGNAGEPLNPEIFHRMREYTGLDMTEGFGQTETSVLIANFPWFKPRPGSMGKPAPLYGIDLVNGDGRSCADGEEGEIVVRNLDAPGLFRGYYRDEALTAQAMRDGCYHTGDVAWRDSDGYYWFVGRNDDVIKCSGYRIGPFEVESALLTHPAVLECAVTAAPDPVRGQVVKATVVLTEKHRGRRDDPALVLELQEHAKRVTAPYKYPRIIVFVDELPKTVGGKIKRAQIRNADMRE